MMSRRSRGRNSTLMLLNYSNPGKESWSGHGAFRGARRRRRGSRLRRPLTRRGAAYKYWRTPGRRKMDQCGNLRALWGGLIDVLVPYRYHTIPYHSRSRRGAQQPRASRTIPAQEARPERGPALGERSSNERKQRKTMQVPARYCFLSM